MIIRPLTKDDVAAYRALRQHILQSKDAQYFSDSFERERALDDKGWMDWCCEKPSHTILGAFDNTALVGVVMMTRQGKHGSPLAEMEAAWVHPSYRGALALRLYKAGLDWAKNNGFDYVVGFVRDNATASARLCEALGFVYAYSINNELWADGSVGNINALVVSLDGDNAVARRAQTKKDMPKILSHAQQCLHAPEKRDAEQPLPAAMTLSVA